MNADDYTWFTKSCGLSPVYCLTLVKGLDQREALGRMDAEITEEVSGLLAFRQYAGDNFPWNRGPFVIGAVRLEGWTLLVEDNGFLGVRPEMIRPLSAGTVVVSHYGGVDGEDEFCWMVDGDLRLHFEPLFPYERSGTDPDGLVEVMREVGFDLRRGEDRDYTQHTEATLALAEYLTGVRLTLDLIDNAQYLCALAPLKR